MTKSPKKREELEHLNSFKYFCTDFPQGQICPRETPDFIIESDGEKIGVEITKIFTDDGRSRNAPQAVEAARDRITDLARKLATEIGGPQRAVTLFFNWTRPLHRGREAEIARAVAQVVHDNLPPEDEASEIECYYGSPQPSEVDGILIHRVHPLERFEWKWTEASRRIEDAGWLIEDAIARKTTVADACFKKCDECWLVIVAGEPTLRASGNIRPNQRTMDRSYKSPFTRTYFLDFGLGSLAQLRTHPGGV